MTIERVRELYEAKPFQPFIIHLADGREIPVLHREFMANAPSGRTIVVFQPTDQMNIIDLLLVTDLEVRPQLAQPVS
jgi:chemotaxis protein CheY-P-specific phosphatase CheC